MLKILENEPKHLFKNNIKSITQDFNNVSLFTKQVKGQKLNNKQSHKNTTHIKELNKKLATDDYLDYRLRDELEEYMIGEIAPWYSNWDYIQNMKMKKIDWLKKMRK